MPNLCFEKYLHCTKFKSFILELDQFIFRTFQNQFDSQVCVTHQRLSKYKKLKELVQKKLQEMLLQTKF